MTIALLAAAIVAATAYLGRHDLTRPQVLLGIVWFTCVAAAQLRLTDAEVDWPTGFTAVVFGGGLAFMAAATAVTGTRAARGAIAAPRESYSTRLMVRMALVLMGGAVIGWIYKAHQFGGIPLFSEHIDATRGSVFAPGGTKIPTWSSALTGGFYLAFWIFIAAAALEWRAAGNRRRALLVALCALCLFGVAFDASRNQVLLAVLVPLIGVYLLAPRPTRRRAALHAAAAALVVALVVGGAFVGRLSQTASNSGANAFLEQAKRQNGPVVRPFLPLYVNAVLPLDAYRQLWGAFPEHAAWGRGAYSTESFPSALYPSGKSAFGRVVSAEIARRGAPFWTVSTYQGRAYGDFGAGGVIAVSMLLGLLFGAAYRVGRTASGLFGAAIIGYVAYYTVYTAYDNLLSFTLIGVYDLGVLLAAQRVAEGRLTRRSLADAASRPRAKPLMAGAAALGAVAILLYAGRGTLFGTDEWAFILFRRGGDLGTFLRPHQADLTLIPIAVLKALFATVGIGHYWPYRLAVGLAHIGVVALLFTMARARVGTLLAIAVAAPILAFGPAFDAVLFPVNLDVAVAMAAGLGAFLALDRRDRAGDVAAGVLLTVSVVSASAGLCFMLGAAVEMLMRRQLWPRILIVAAPLLLYGAWYIAYNIPPDRPGPLEYGPAIPFAIHLATAALSAIYALPLGFETAGRSYHRLLELLSYAALVAAVAALAWRIRRLGRVTPRVAALSTCLAAYLVLTGVTRAYAEQQYSSRYVYPAAILVLALAVEAARGAAIPRRVALVCVSLALAAGLGNAAWLVHDGQARAETDETLAAELGAIEIGRDIVPRSLPVDPAQAPFLTAGNYLSTADSLGSPALDPAELPHARPRSRSAADALLLQFEVQVSRYRSSRARPATAVALAGSGEPFARRRGRCLAVRPPRGREVTAIFRVPANGVVLRSRVRSGLRVQLRRFASTFARPLATPDPRRPGFLVVARPDRSPQPWIAAVSHRALFRIC